MKSTFVIRELAGQKRIVTLNGAGLPKQGSAGWGGTNKMATTWYPGNTSQATQQMLGGQEKASTFEGFWRSTQLVRTPAIFEPFPGRQVKLAFADGLREVVEDMLRSGVLLQVYWVNAEAATFGGRSIQRLGRASDWNFTYDRMDDLAWTITFEWTSRGLGQQKALAIREDGTNQAAIAAFEATTIAVNDAVNQTKMNLSRRGKPNSASKFTLEQLGGVLDAPKRLMKDFSQSMNRLSNRLTKLGELVSKVRGMPYEIAAQSLDIATGAVQAANKFNDALTRTPPEVADLQHSLKSLLRAASYTKGGKDAADIVVANSIRSSMELRKQIDSRRASGEGGKAFPTGGNAQATLNGNKTQVQVHLVKQGDTLISIAMTYYGVPEGAYGIAVGNGLSLKAIPPVGKVLIIPPLSAGPTNFPQLPVAPAGGDVTLPNGNPLLPSV